MSLVLVDTGPLVALLAARDAHHGWACEAFASVQAPLSSCEAVVTEACFLLSRWPEAVDALLARVESGALIVHPMATHARPIRRLMKKYADVPMSFADACLVQLTELHDDATVMTLDSDFHVYRRHGRRTIPLIAPGP